MLRALAILSILGAVLILTSGLAVWLVLAAGYWIGTLARPRNPCALHARQRKADAIPDKRHTKRDRSQRRRDALRQEQERDG